MASSRCSDASSLRARTVSSCVNLLKPPPKPSRPTPRVRQTRRRALILSFRLRSSSTLQSSTSSPDCATHRHATIYGVNAHAVASPGKRRSKWRKRASSHTPQTGLLFHAAIASDTSSTTCANSAQVYTTSSNNCAITTPCATGNSGNPPLVMSTLRVRALHRATGAPPIPATPPRLQSTCGSSIP